MGEKKKKIIKGMSDFHQMISKGAYYVDKTLFVKEFMENGDHVLLIPRPRRFGKSLNLSMTQYFLDIQKSASKELFSEYKISEDKAFCQKHQNKHPVIHVTLKSAGGGSWKECLNHLKTIMSDVYRQYQFLLQSDKLDQYEKEKFENILSLKADRQVYEYSLVKLNEYLFRYFNKPAVILIDEYDSPIIEGFQKGYYKEIIEFMQTFLGEAFKGNVFLEKGLITGILRVAKESIFSKFNNPGVYTITSNYFSDYFGFTQKEINDILKYFDLEDDATGIKKWYNGYQFGSTKNMYNPWSIIGYILRHKDGFITHWANSGGNHLIRDYILKPDPNKTYDSLEKLTNGDMIEKPLYEDFVFSDLNGPKEMLWTLLTFGGYLTVVRSIDDKRKYYELRVPNYEVRTIYQDFIIDWLQGELKVIQDLVYDTARHLINNRIVEFEKGFKEIMGDTFSYFDMAGESEKVFQSYILGLLAVIGDDYLIKSNRESGEGRYDIMLLPRDKNKYPNGVVLEIKRLKTKENESREHLTKRVNDKLDEAQSQIETKKYYKELSAHKIEHIIKLPIVFVGKEPYIRPLETEK